MNSLRKSCVIKDSFALEFLCNKCDSYVPVVIFSLFKKRVFLLFKRLPTESKLYLVK